MRFDLSKYETVKARKKRFYTDYPDGRIEVTMLNLEECLEYALFQARVYCTSEDQGNQTPRGIGYALEIRDKELSKTKDGKSYESVNYSSWTENCEESAVGRALDNAGYASAPSQDEMIKAERHAKTITKQSQSKCPECGTTGKYHSPNCSIGNIKETKCTNQNLK